MSQKWNIKNVYDLLEQIEKRPGLFIGNKELSTLRSFLDGFQFAEMAYDTSSEPVFPHFWYFHEWVRRHYAWEESTAGWKNIILQENGGDEEKSLVVFFELLREFRKLTPKSILKADLGERQMAFHHSEACKIKKYTDPVNEVTGPLYEEADEVLIVEFSHDFGFFIIVRWETKPLEFGWRERFLTKADAIKHCERLFGEELNWGELTANLEEIAPSLFDF